MQNPDWQDQLRDSVRLYLDLGAVHTLAQEVDIRLQRIESQLLDYLLAGTPAATPPDRQHARHLLDMAQHELLDSALHMTPELHESRR
jgi:hypothetical protein